MPAKGLTRDELIYELRLRHVHNLDYMNISLLRSSLNMLLSEPVDLNFPDVEIDVAADFEICQNKYEELNSLVQSFAGNALSSAYSSLDHRILHVLNRLRRLLNRASAPILDEIKRCLDKTVELDVLLNSKSMEDTNVSSPLQSDSMSSTPLNTHYGVQYARLPVQVDPVYKWGVTFDGKEPVSEFLERIEELRVARRASKEHLFCSAIELFSGIALLWYRSMREEVHDWDSLVSALRAHFLPPDYDFDLLQSIHARKQKPSEKVIEYVATLRHLFQKLIVPLSEFERIRILKKNLLPCFRHKITLLEIASVSRLTEILLELENDGVGAIPENIMSVEVDNIESAVNSRPSGSSSTTFNRITCWNCQQVGHRHRNCTVARNKFCFRCGRANVVVNNCPNCSTPNVNSGNE